MGALKNVLNNQEKAMLGAADAQIAAANATLQQNKSIENQVALTNALANREGVLAQIEGLRSEQKANDLALNKELLDLTKSKQEAETQLAIDQKQFDAERLKDEDAILLAKKSALELNVSASKKGKTNYLLSKIFYFFNKRFFPFKIFSPSS